MLAAITGLLETTKNKDIMKTYLQRNAIYNTSLALVLVLLVFTACGKDNPVNVQPGVIAGDYIFTEFQFTPDAAALQTANVLDSLVAAETYLRLTSGGQFILNYRYKGSIEAIISGDFTATASSVTLKAASGSDARLSSLLLSSPIVLVRLGETGSNEALTSTSTKTVNLASYSSHYAGVPPVRGVLTLSLTRKP